MALKLVLGYHAVHEVSALFSEYTQLLIDGDPAFQQYLAIQHYDEELAHLEEKYSLPQGRLYLAYWNDALAGCIALWKLDALRCEMKRLYVRPQFRGKQIGNHLIAQIIDDARMIGYRQMFLDTLPFLRGAIHLYERFGFQPTECYNDSPMASSIYMKLDL